MEWQPYTNEQEVTAQPADELLLSEAFLVSWLRRYETSLPSHRLSGENWRGIFKTIFLQDNLGSPEINETPKAVFENAKDAAEHDEPIEAELELRHERKDASTLSSSRMHTLVNSKLPGDEEISTPSYAQLQQGQYQDYDQQVLSSRQKQQSIVAGIVIAFLLMAIVGVIYVLLQG
jgi:hypothetical protein